MPNKRKIYLWADADKQIGFGHFTRSLALADILKEGFECTFFTQAPTSYQKEEVGKICDLVELPVDETKFSLFLSYLKGNEIVVLDNYFFTSDYQKKVKSRGCKLVCLGTNDRHYYADVVLNFAENDPSIFSVEPYTQVVLGVEWVILREPFRRAFPVGVEKNRDVVICFGGTDQYGLIEECVDALAKCSDIDSIHIIATDIIGIERIISLNKKKRVTCHINLSAQQVAAIMRQSFILISSASTVALEGIACGCKLVCGYYVDNQKRMYEYLTDNGYALGLGSMLLPAMQKKLLLATKEILLKNDDLKDITCSDLDKKYTVLFNEL
jgi:spore coat polysaccharide biosynthesis predicted glycosyltransferase SpsG